MLEKDKPGARRDGEDRWPEAERYGGETESWRQEFVRGVLRRTEGIAAEREKFLRGLKTGSPKTP
ncbi:hypothetical protein [Thermanaeromonas sp. C210]|uniref:hypothetical protein n=1 Tax=Thermanaeromonas sp. C210 TaxID=2731925 RepID=UPI00155C4BB6|nr:hypothetical protein [Thermanaeromonas sp. C210]GFN22935.1 hypothetical protein TAMC210_12520 [Thermanaeromonas sp. C210]